MAAQNPIIDIKSGPLFPFPFLVLGAGSLLAGIGMFVTYPIISLALVLLGGMILTANSALPGATPTPILGC